MSPEGFALMAEMLANQAIDVDAVLAHIRQQWRDHYPVADLACAREATGWCPLRATVWCTVHCPQATEDVV